MNQIGKFGYENITYEEACTIEKHSNVKEISVIRYSEKYKNITSARDDIDFQYIAEFDENAINNLVKNSLIEGRLPQNSNEVVIDINDNFDEIGDKLIQTLENGNTKEYTVVGVIWPIQYPDRSNYAITLLDRNDLKSDDKVDITLLSYDVKQIYSDYYDIYYQLDSYMTPQGSSLDTKVQYNKTLLEYEGALDYSSRFQKDIYTIEGVFIGIVVICSAIFIYSVINISVVERKRYFGILKSIGATSKQMRRSVRIELLVVLIITLPIGILIGIGLDYILVTILNNAIPELAISYSTVGNILKVDGQLLFAIPMSTVAIAIIIVIATVYISSMLPIRKVTWAQAINLIKQNKEKVHIRKKKKAKELKNVEFTLATKNIERYKVRYVSIIMSLVICITLIIVSNYYLENISEKEYISNYNYQIELSYEKNVYGNLLEKIIDDIQEANIAEKIISIDNSSTYNILVNKEDISDEEKEFSKKIYGDSGAMAHFRLLFASHEFDYSDVLNTYYLYGELITLNEDAYNAYLKEIGVDKLEKDEVILVDFFNQKTKYYNGIKLTKYKDGDELRIKNGGYTVVATEDEVQKDSAKLKIKKVTNKMPEGLEELEDGLTVFFIGTEEAKQTLYKQFYGEDFGNSSNTEYRTINLKVKNIKEADVFVERMKEKYKLNYSDESHRKTGEISGEGKEAQEMIDTTLILKTTFIYSFICTITLVGILNMYNAINTNLEIRKKEVVRLITLGMEKRQINKMLFIENAICGLLALILGVAIGLAIDYALYYINIDYKWYAFEIPWLSIVLSVVGIIVVTLISTAYLKKKIFTNNLIEILKDEDI